ncbi:MAG TPA: hypothetical protein VFH15_01870 [Pyrinomonadaceae bacterium]|nr:hypothetical protein [Pyrinomonadaceae bacterium]
MFVGHYGPSFAIKSIERPLRLWVLFIAVQLLDVVWSLLVFIGVEKVRIVPGITASNPFDLYYMPYTHSLVAAIAWAIAATIFSKVLLNVRNWSAGILVGAAVFSHWVLDFVVHRPDLPLYDDAAKVGLGLWNYPIIALSLEALLLFGGMLMYLKRTRPLSSVGRFGPPIFGLIMLAIQGYIFFGPPPASPVAAAVTALVSYVFFAAVAHWLDRNREPTSS